MISFNTSSRIFQFPILLLFVFLFFVLTCKDSSGAEKEIKKTAKEKAVEIGLRIYRDGKLPNGEPLTAVVAGDVTVLGTQFSCQNCHGRSGMGAAEGKIIVPAIAGPILYSASPQPKRSAYDYKSLARALREGVNPNGRALDSLMPRYKLSNNEIKSLATYLQGLSASASPGVDNKIIRFATVVSEAENKNKRDAVLSVLHAYFNVKNKQTRLEGQRPDRGSSPASRLPSVFRKWVLDVWVLKGASESWPEQLEKYYKNAPVFALIGGVTDHWKPIGRFCENHEVPCLFPSTSLPITEEGDFYSLHFSAGLMLEANLIANHTISRNFKSVIQVYCGPDTKPVINSLSKKLKKKSIRLHEIAFDCKKPLLVDRLAKQITSDPEAAVILWLKKNQISELVSILPENRVYMSSTLLNGKQSLQLPSLPVAAYLAHPFKLPGKFDSALIRFKVWARSRKIDVRYPSIQSETFFACIAVNDAVSHLERFLIRDYMLDMLDHAQPLTAYIPRPTIGPGQRFLSKGGYVLATQNGKLTTKNAVLIFP